MKVVRSFVRDLVVAWADRIKGEREVRRKKRKADRRIAEAVVIEAIVGDQCVHGERSRVRYCDRCPLGEFNGDLSRDVQRMICARPRRYSK